MNGAFGDATAAAAAMTVAAALPPWGVSTTLVVTVAVFAAGTAGWAAATRSDRVDAIAIAIVVAAAVALTGLWVDLIAATVGLPRPETAGFASVFMAVWSRPTRHREPR